MRLRPTSTDVVAEWHSYSAAPEPACVFPSLTNRETVAAYPSSLAVCTMLLRLTRLSKPRREAMLVRRDGPHTIRHEGW